MNIQEQKILNIIKEFSEKLPKFSDGRIDYSNSNIAPVVIVFIKYKNEILLLKRSDKVRTYPPATLSAQNIVSVRNASCNDMNGYLLRTG